MELGGLLGSLIAGRISDWYIATSPGGAVGKRIQVVMAYLIGVAAMLADGNSSQSVHGPPAGC